MSDVWHIKSHLDGQVNTNQQMNEEQMRYHYFKMHDHNNDNALDGLELIQAITHYHGDNTGPDAPPPPKFQETELESITNNILRDDDYNNDGYIDYSEFVKSQAARTSAPPPGAPPK
uniref:EF-hand domain-containing protein n=1 Tax=Romanomermis culicivorax TaxID=13658 RepID=A0A915JJ95_ROMCU